ncbi:vacuolar membrane protein-domain-containing protein [Sporodiniella umbellata]|nr:vacuolar membrane protein-domain-containing protein [Sporodiniella umbellata]
MQPEDENSCQLLDGFAIAVQLTLCLTAILTLVYKRSREKPQRPIEIWMLDVSKQFIGAGIIHFINIGISYATESSLCVVYFLNVAMDTTLGVLILWCWMKVILALLKKARIPVETCCTLPIDKRTMLLWLQQLIVFLLAIVLSKICFYEILVLNEDWLCWLGELAISWTNSSPKLQLLFVMLIFPVVMNAIQFWLTDTIIQQRSQTIDFEQKAPTESTPLFISSA